MSKYVEYKPLDWPNFKPRTSPSDRKRAAFSQSNGKGWKENVTMQKALRRISEQITALDKKYYTSYILTLETPFGKSGYPLSNRRTPEDCGVAVYFKINDKPLVLACDKWDRVEDNIVALAKHIEALRGQERWGVATTEQAFAGHMALPAPIIQGEHWSVTLNIPSNADVEIVKAAYKRLARQYHSDTEHGDSEKMSAINVARDNALKELGG